MGYLFRDPQEIMEAFVKDYFPNMKTKTRAARLIGLRDNPTRREVSLAMHMLALHFHTDKGLFDKWAQSRLRGVDYMLIQQAKLLVDQLWERITTECRTLQTLDDGYYQKALLNKMNAHICRKHFKVGSHNVCVDAQPCVLPLTCYL